MTNQLHLESLEARQMMAADLRIVDPVQPGDADRDMDFDPADVTQMVQSGKYLTDQAADWQDGDFNGDGRFDQSDLVLALQQGNYSPIQKNVLLPPPHRCPRILRLELRPGDVNFDGKFDQEDLLQLAKAGTYLNDEFATWREGDFNRDGRFDQDDIVLALETEHNRSPYHCWPHISILPRPTKPLPATSSGFVPYELSEMYLEMSP